MKIKIKENKNETPPKKVAHKRTEPYDALERREQKKEATGKKRSHKKHEKGEHDIKEEQVEKGLTTSPHKSSQK